MQQKDFFNIRSGVILTGCGVTYFDPKFGVNRLITLLTEENVFKSLLSGFIIFASISCVNLSEFKENLVTAKLDEAMRASVRQVLLNAVGRVLLGLT